MFQDFMTPEVLTTFGGLTTAVIVITQFTKSIVKKRYGDGCVRIYAFIIALVLSFIFMKRENGFADILSTVLNAMMIAIGSMGGYELLADPLAKKTR